MAERAVGTALRLWPGVVLVTFQWALRFALPAVAPQYMAYGVMGSLACGVLVALWWLLFSRAPWVERILAIVIMAGGVYGMRFVADPSITKGAMGMLLPMLSVPGLCLALVVWAVLARPLSGSLRLGSMAAALLAACGVWGLVRTGGFSGDFKNDLHWRWTPSAEDRLVASAPVLPVAPPAEVAAPVTAPTVTPAPAEAAAAPTAVKVEEESAPAAEWPGFRGPERNGVNATARVGTDWAASPPQKLWTRAVGPGWSSFSVRGDVFYTQEQRGPDEIVAAYRVSTGEPVWVHKDKARFWESNAGAGPRGTPTVSGKRVYALGGTGILNALDASTGRVVWSRNAATDGSAKTPEWGFSGSPLVYGDLLIVAASGQLVGYDLGTGNVRWLGPKHLTSYSSPQLAKFGGVPQVVQLSTFGATSVDPASGKALWEHEWKGYPIVQSGFTGDGELLMAVKDDSGVRRLGVSRDGASWGVQERWTSNGLKPYFNDFVVHKGFAYGFDGAILSCIDLQDGKRKWKGGRYGHGQMLLLAGQDLLLVLGEEGELALVKATADGFSEVAKMQVLEGKTWNHPVVVGDVLLVRNGEQMAAFRLPAPPPLRSGG